MSIEVKRAHSMEIAVGADKHDTMLYLTMVDENDNVFAELVVDPNHDWLSDFMNILIELTLTARLRQRALEDRVTH